MKKFFALTVILACLLVPAHLFAQSTKAPSVPPNITHRSNLATFHVAYAVYVIDFWKTNAPSVLSKEDYETSLELLDTFWLTLVNNVAKHSLPEGWKFPKYAFFSDEQKLPDWNILVASVKSGDYTKSYRKSVFYSQPLVSDPVLPTAPSLPTQKTADAYVHFMADYFKWAKNFNKEIQRVLTDTFHPTNEWGWLNDEDSAESLDYSAADTGGMFGGVVGMAFNSIYPKWTAAF